MTLDATMYEAVETLPLSVVLMMAATRAELSEGEEAITVATSPTMICVADGATMAPLSV